MELTREVETLPRGVSRAARKGGFDTKDKLPTERSEQERVARWLRECRADICFCAQLGGEFASARKRASVVRQGYEAGTPDLAVFEPRGDFHGLFIEMKARRNGRLSDRQRDKLAQLQRKGYQVYVAHGADDAITALQHYLTSNDGRL